MLLAMEYHYLCLWRAGPPVPIPNTEVKLLIVDDTCLETSRKSRTVQVPIKNLVEAGFFCGHPEHVRTSPSARSSCFRTIEALIVDDTCLETSRSEREARQLPPGNKK